MNYEPSQRPRIEIPPQQVFLEPSLSFILSFAERMGMDVDRREHLKRTTRAAIETVMANNVDGPNEARVGVECYENKGQLYVEVLNRGVPIFLDSVIKRPDGGRLHESSKQLETLSIQNLGRQGQNVVIGMRLGEEAARKSLEPAAIKSLVAAAAGDEFLVRKLELGEESALSQLFFHVYGYQYIHEFVYYPEKLRTLLEEGKLISIVAASTDGQLLGHVGLMKWNESPTVFEPCLGVTDPRVRSRGLFGTLFQKTMEFVEGLSCQYLFFDFVTNHDLTQKFVAKYNPVDLAIFVGCQSKETQARLERFGLGPDPKDMDRYSLLYSVVPRVAHPFGREIRLPNNLGELLGFLLEPLNLDWRPSSRFELLPVEGDYQSRFQPAQSSVLFDMPRPGRLAIERVLKEWRQLLKSGYQYASIEIPVDTHGLGPSYDILAESGFFVAGFLPYHHSDRLAIRFQAIGHTKVSFENIKTFSPTAKRLLEIIRANYERNVT